MQQPLLSIVVPAYNAQAFIKNAIDSFLSQAVDWAELIIVDDGSKDNTYDAISPYVSDTIKYFRTENLGAGHARNYGVTLANGKWVGFLDSDDLIYPDAFKSLENTLNTEYDIDIVYCSKARCSMDSTEDISIIRAEMGIKNCMPCLEFWSCIYKREFLNRESVRFFEYKEQDIESAFRFRAFSKTDRVKVCSDIVLVIYRNNPSSNTHTWNVLTLCRVKSLVYLELFKEYTGNNEEILDNLFTVYKSYFAYFILHCLKGGISKNADMSLLKQNIVYLAKSLRLRKKVHLPSKIKIFCFFFSILKYNLMASVFLKICRKKKA